jgi:hypothetical protein
MTNPTQINQGGAQNQERQDPAATGKKAQQENTRPMPDPNKSTGELTEGRTAPMPARNQMKQQGIMRDERGQEQPKDQGRAQQTSSRSQHGESDPPVASDDDPTSGDEAQNRPDKIQRQEKAEGGR